MGVGRAVVTSSSATSDTTGAGVAVGVGVAGGMGLNAQRVARVAVPSTSTQNSMVLAGREAVMSTLLKSHTR